MNTHQYSVRRGKRFFLGLLIIAAVFGISGIVMFLWNAIIPSLFEVSSITYWQAMGLLVLCRILTGGFHFGRRHAGPWRSPRAEGFRDKWMNMSEEERAKMKAMWRERCGHRGRPGQES